MTFRKNDLLFHEILFFGLFMAILSLCLIPILGVGLSLLYAAPIIVLILFWPKLCNDFVTVNENGISCYKSDVCIWAYNWESIAELRKGSLYRMPAIYIILHDESGKPEQFALHDHYFQLGKQAKEAVKRYYRPDEAANP